MIRTAYFQALAPDAQFPKTAFNLKVNDVRYHLPLPLLVGDYLAGLLSPTGPFRCLEHYCSPLGIEILRTQPDAFEQNRGFPTYAESEKCLQSDQGVLTIHEIAASTLAAAEIERFAIEGGILSPEIAEWIMENSIFFQHCGGFVLALVHYSFSPTDYEFDDGVIQITDPEGLLETRPRSNILRQLLAASEARS